MFSKIDLKTGYWQIFHRGEDKHKTAFVTYEGQYNFMTMGLCGASSTFQKCMDRVLKGVKENFAMPSKMTFWFGLQIQHVKEVLSRLLKVTLIPNWKKCIWSRITHLLWTSITAWMHNIYQAKVSDIEAMKTPKNFKQLRTFIGMANWHRKYIPNYRTTHSLNEKR